MLSHHCLLVGFLNGVTRYVTVAVIFRWLPLQGHIKAPHIHNLQGFRGSWEIYTGEKNYI